MIDQMNRARREGMRWMLILTLNYARPAAYSLNPVLDVVRQQYPDCTLRELCAELEYLQTRELVKIDRRPDGDWKCALTRHGIDLAEYTIDCEPGIARPSREFWQQGE